MGHSCRICGRVRPNEAFSGRGHTRHLCKQCARLPKAERDRTDRLEALYGMLFRQSNISQGNIQTALTWAESDDVEVATLARIVAAVGRAHPRRKKRLPTIARRHSDLWKRMVAAGLVDEWLDRSCDPEEPEDDEWHVSPEEPRAVFEDAHRVDARLHCHSDPEPTAPDGREVAEKPLGFDDEDIPF